MHANRIMASEPPRMGDFWRITFGDTAGSFALEVVFRLVVLYALLLISMRLMGRRVASQLTQNEIVALVSLAAAVGPAVGTPDQGLLPPIVVAIWVVLVQRVMAWSSFRVDGFERLMQGESATLVRDGQLDLPALRRNAISRDALFATLRSAGAMSLGSVERAYLEPNGSFSVLHASERHPGLTLVPAWDVDLLEEQEKAAGQRACKHCGLLERSEWESPCPACRASQWTAAVY
jgi:uncharacterized membrane protein YcaP (DUF421 family)